MDTRQNNQGRNQLQVETRYIGCGATIVLVLVVIIIVGIIDLIKML